MGKGKAGADLVLRGGTVIDGTGARRYAADVAISGDRISAIGDLAGLTVAQSVDVSGLIVAPGFIDVHTHDDAALIETPDMAMKASQGVTTVICGNCGASAFPYDKKRPPSSIMRLLFKNGEVPSRDAEEFFDKVAGACPALNAAFLVGHSTLRIWAMGDDLTRKASQAEIGEMRARLEDGLKAGAIGLSSGLFYPPAMAASTDEVAEIAAPLGAYGGVYCAHIRDEGDHIVGALYEAFEIGRRAGAPTVVSHHKLSGRANFGRSVETLKLFDQAMAKQKIAFDVYPYIAGSTILRPEMVDRADKVLVTWSEAMPQYTARDLDEVAEELGLDRQAACRKLLPAGAVYFMMDEADVQRIMAHPAAMIGSDGIPGDAHPHPRLWGTFPRVLGHYARDLALFPLEEAVRRMSGLSARNFGLSRRGTIAIGNYADLAVFDARTIGDTATFEKPIQPASGVKLVLVNGTPVWRDGKSTGERPGKTLRRQDLQAAAV